MCLACFFSQTQQHTQEREENAKRIEDGRLLLTKVEAERNEAQEAKEKLMTDFNDLQQTYENVRTEFLCKNGSNR